MPDSTVWGDSATPSDRPASRENARDDNDEERPTEATPLLQRNSEDEEEHDQESQNGQPGSSRASVALLGALSSSSKSKGKGSWRWPSIVALVVLSVLLILIIVFAFIAPQVVQEYSTQAVVFKPTSLSIPSFTGHGVKARIQGEFSMDGSKVKNKPVRDLGRFGTWIARRVESKESRVEVSLPEYGNVVLGTATIPPIEVDVRDGHITQVDFVADLTPGKFEGIRKLANDWIDGRIGHLRVMGKASVPLKSGIFSLGTRNLKQSMVFSGQ